MKMNTVLFADENVEVIYVSPVCLGEDVLQYYTHLLGLETAIELGDASAPESNCAKRFTILMPEALEYFSVWCSTHTLTLPLNIPMSQNFLHFYKKKTFITLFLYQIYK